MKKWAKYLYRQSKDKMKELFAVSISLSSQNVNENENDNIFSNAAWIRDNLVGNQKNSTNILEAVRGKKESNTSSFDSISEHWFNFFVHSTSVIDRFNIFNQGQKISFSLEIIGVLEIRQNLLL